MSLLHPTPVATADLPALRADLVSANYSVDGIKEVLGELANEALHREQPIPAVRALAGNTTPRALLVRLFILGHALTEQETGAAFPSLGAEGAVRMRLVVAHEGGYRAAAEIRPHAFSDDSGEFNGWLASDLGEVATGGALHADHVLGAGGASLTLAQFTMRDAVDRVLDLGTGCGIQALHAARHARTIVATDISQRAAQYVQFNAALNEVEFDVRLGSMLEPVAGEQFDLIVSNPPFVITPRTDSNDDTLPLYEYRDGGRSGDDLVHDLIVSIGGSLAPGGIAQMLGNWEIRGTAPWTERVTQWLDQAEALHGPLDAWIVQREVLDPAQYAETWIRDGGTTMDRDPAAYEATFNAWLDDFESRDVQAIGFGMIVLRKPKNGQRTLRRLEEITGTVQQPLGPVISQSLAAHDWHTAQTNEELRAQRLVFAPDVTDERYFTPGTEDPNVIIIRQGGGYGRAIQATTALAGLVGACDGDLTVGQILDAISSLFEVSPHELTEEVLPDVRGLITDGLLVPAP